MNPTIEDIWHAISLLQPVTDRHLAKRYRIPVTTIRRHCQSINGEGGVIIMQPIECIGDKRVRCNLLSTPQRDLFPQ